MITEMLPLLAVAALITIARNLYEFYVVDRTEQARGPRDVSSPP